MPGWRFPLASGYLWCLAPTLLHRYRTPFVATSTRTFSSTFASLNPTASSHTSSDGEAKKKTVAYMFRQLKLAGAHPDIVWSIDAVKAQHNGEEMARLETLLHERATKGRRSLSSLPPQLFFFWLCDPNNRTALRKVSSYLHLSATPEILHEQLQKLFQEAGIREDFTLEGEEEVHMSVESLLKYADAQQNTHIKDAGALYIRAERAVEQLRRHGVVVVVSDTEYSYLVTLPEAGFHQLVDNVSPPAQQCSSFAGNARKGCRPMRSIVGPHGELDPDAQEYMEERGLRPFELRMTGTAAAMEAYVSAFERLERLYDVHRGRAFRPGVCLVLRIPPLPSSAGGGGGFLARDGCLVLSMHHLALWEPFLLGLTQDKWKYAVEQHRQWRVGSAPKLEAQRRQLKKLADAFGFFQLRLHGPMGAIPWNGTDPGDAASPLPSSGGGGGGNGNGNGKEANPSRHAPLVLDVESTVAALSLEEPIIRKTLHKYKVYSSVLQKRGTMVMVPRLTSKCHTTVSSSTAATPPTSAAEEIGYRLQGDGVVYFNRRMMSTPKMLRVLRDNIKRIESYKISYDRCTASLEHLSRVLPIDFSIDTEWKIYEETRFSTCLEKFVNTMKAHQHPIAALLKSVEHAGGQNGGGSSPSPDTNPHASPQEALRAQLEYEAGTALPSSPGNMVYRKALERRYVWVISEKLEALPTGVLFIPYNVDFASLRRCLLTS